ncbi:MAG: M16 family metallopeptidase, partial [Acidobacteriota bacterium]
LLSNGLRVVLLEDHSTPIVAVNLWYHVGSKNEVPGRTGFAHLFEHMMFQGSEHHDTDFFAALEPVGATDLNGTTNSDRTNYFENVPTSALERTLWLEADRMGWLLPSITQERLDNQREVVKNERRQSYENQPYGLVNERMLAALYPKNHPYNWPVIGNMADLTAASKEDVQDFFKKYYGPNNATLVIAGDLQPGPTLDLVRKYFGSIPPGPPVARPEAWVPELHREVRLSMEDRVPLSRLYIAWHAPGAYQPGEAELDLLAGVLGRGKNSRLYKRLVYDLQVAQDVNAFVDTRELSSLFRVRVTVKKGHSLDEIEPLVLEEIEHLRTWPPTSREVERARTTLLARMVRGLDRIGGFGGKSDLLGRYATYTGDPNYIQNDFARYNQVTARAVRDSARRWLHQGRVIMRVTPYPDLEPAQVAKELDRAVLPPLGAAPDLVLPKLERATLPNGVEVLLAHTSKVPAVQLNLLVRGGWSSDRAGMLGLASFMANMLDEGTATRSALEISDAAQTLGAVLNTGSSLDAWNVNLSALKARLEPSIRLWADIILNPAFPAAEIERQRKQVLGRIMQEKRQPVGIAFRIMPALLYGENHPYGQPLTGSGTEETIRAIRRDDLVQAHASWFKPGNATVVVVGDTTLPEILPLLEKNLAGWKPGAFPAVHFPAPRAARETVVYLIDKPDAAQSVLLCGHLAPPKHSPDDVPLQVLNTVLGGQFTSRLNMNLREDKGYSYGAFSIYLGARGPGALIGFSQVRTDVTKESIAEVVKEFRDIRGPRPVSQDELEKAQANLTLSLPGRYESLSEVAGMFSDLVTYDLPEDYYETFPAHVRAIRSESLTQLARKRIHPDKLILVVIGDLKKIEAGIRGLELGPVKYLDTDGRPVEVARASRG